MIVYNSKLGTEKDRAIGETSGTQEYLLLVLQRKGSGTSRSSNFDIQPDSSDVETSDSELEEGEFSKHELDFERPAERSSLWTEILDLASTFSLDMKLWIIVGDFNQIRDPFELSLMSTMNLDKRIRDFNQYLSNANLENLNFRGTTFTWWNKRNLLPLAKRFDLCLVNDEW
ncbi:hypothetical protein F2Q68_00003834 [Brassica cretica]|uniref:Endonuclease/exonuclease/phosphatase domain-containing protein n=1 Tax=Brassica cretica TaxID=69181 RepID=A0A8S9JMS5_BRACR|nr:hypothetical protein F2Q68_00003834 [Brassica cretica]